jgi:hypothetical protein
MKKGARNLTSHWLLFASSLLAWGHGEGSIGHLFMELEQEKRP